MEAPNPKLQIPKKIQAPNSKRPPHPRRRRGRKTALHGFMVPMQIPGMSELSTNRRTNMPLLRSFGKQRGILAAIDMAFLLSFSMRIIVPMHDLRTSRFIVPRTSLRLNTSANSNMGILPQEPEPIASRRKIGCVRSFSPCSKPRPQIRATRAQHPSQVFSWGLNKSWVGWANER